MRASALPQSRHLPPISASFLLLLTLACPLQAQGDAAGERNLASTSTLPQGDGLAKDFPADANVASHTAVLFADNFESGDFQTRWDTGRDDHKGALSRTAPGESESRLGRTALRVTATLGRNTGGGLTKWFDPVDRLFIRFYTRFHKECDYVHHFCTLRANKSLQGGDRWSGFGGAGIQPKGDERFSTALEPWGNWGRFTPPGRWNFYSYWHEMRPSPDGKFWGNSFQPAAQPDIVRGRWICAEFMLRHNTPGIADGEQAFWINGELRGHWTGINWRKTPGLKANAFTLESYVTDRWTKHPTNIVDFDNVVIASQYIGPSASAPDK